MDKEYDDNKLAADLKYKGEILQLSGTVGGIGEVSKGHPFIYFTEENGILSPVYCYFTASWEPTLASLVKGQKVTVQGSYVGDYFLGIDLQNCHLVSQ